MILILKTVFEEEVLFLFPFYYQGSGDTEVEPFAGSLIIKDRKKARVFFLLSHQTACSPVTPAGDGVN